MSNDRTLADFYEKACSSPFLLSLARKTGLEPATWLSGMQPMIAAFSHSSEGRPKRIFDEAYGARNSCLALPGGHGQCFRVLRSIFAELHKRGIRYACLGNVDNLGFTPDPLELAIMAISGRPAAFDFALRTPMDVKGGILVETVEGGLTVADIGAAISLEAMLDLERKGFPILFNCASGIFDLDYLVPRIEEIAGRLPVRFSDQDKDAGKYSQAEQVTWEVTGILPSFIAFAVEKQERFIAAKLLIDTLLTSGVGVDDPAIPENVRTTATMLHSGLASLLRNAYGLELSNGKWTPRELFSM
jgi:UDP-N-acetylglucosamine pyrophosphorylase